jgi:hypothetical protein
VLSDDAGASIQTESDFFIEITAEDDLVTGMNFDDDDMI